VTGDALARVVGEAIGAATGRPARVVSSHGIGGGCISVASAITLEDGRRYFLKHKGSGDAVTMFAREAEGLRALREPGVLRVPEVVAVGGGEGGAPAFLVLERVETGPRAADFQEQLGRGLARLHRATQVDRFGFDHDNFIGATPQPNDWLDDWVGFWRERRLGFQLSLAERAGLLGARELADGRRLMDRLPDLIGEPDESACLLHGDLWGGNVIAGPTGEPVLIDPAAYLGRREADLAMTLLFGGFTRAFYRAYEDEWPLAPGSEKRLAIYKLYHLLNHLNLFGSGYRSECAALLRELAGG
jgi:fructosamine-3-kinase